MQITLYAVLLLKYFKGKSESKYKIQNTDTVDNVCFLMLNMAQFQILHVTFLYVHIQG